MGRRRFHHRLYQEKATLTEVSKFFELFNTSLVLQGKLGLRDYLSETTAAAEAVLFSPASAHGSVFTSYYVMGVVYLPR